MGFWRGAATMPTSRKKDKKAHKRDLHFLVTLCPSMPHFARFATDYRLSGIRINSAQMYTYELDSEIEAISKVKNPVPLFYDIKGMQLRVEEVVDNPDCLEMRSNHPIKVNLPTEVLFKAEQDSATLVEIKDGNLLIFEGGPKWMVRKGESFHIRHPSLEVGGDTFTPGEKEKIAKVRAAGFTRYCLSYVQKQRHVDEFAELVGKDSDIVLKIEDPKGLRYVAEEYKWKKNRHLMAARGDLFVEVNKPHDIIAAMKTIIGADPGAWVGSRLLLSVIPQRGPDGKYLADTGPSCADFSDIAWLYEIGYRKMLLCDELCMKQEWLGTCVNVLEAFRSSYAKR
jgi:pyruvate kinase